MEKDLLATGNVAGVEEVINIVKKFGHKVTMWNTYDLIANPARDGVNPRTIEVLNELSGMGVQNFVVSNASAMNYKLMERYSGPDGLEIGRNIVDFLTAGNVLHNFIIKNLPQGGLYCVFGRENDPVFAGTGWYKTDNLNKAKFIYLGIPQWKNPETGEWEDQTDGTKFEPELRKLAELGLPFYAANGGDDFAIENGRPVYRQGSAIKFLKRIGAKEVYHFAKPGKMLYEQAMSGLDVRPEEVLYVGDTIETDGKFIFENGGDFACLRWGDSGLKAKEMGITIEEYAEKCGYPQTIFLPQSLW